MFFTIVAATYCDRRQKALEEFAYSDAIESISEYEQILRVY